MGINRVILVLFLVFSLGVSWCYGGGEIGIAPMEKAEQAALYSAIQGFMGNWWNGSDLFPDPCGWTLIEVQLLTDNKLYCCIAESPFDLSLWCFSVKE